MQDYLGSERGMVVGPYEPGEIRARLRGRAWLESQGAKAVYAVRAASPAEAKARIMKEARSR